MKTIERTELIDRYLLGEATAEEKMQVERLLSDPELSLEDRDKFRKEMELQQEIILAIQKQGLKEMLQKEEKHIRYKHNVTKVTILSLSGGGFIAAMAAVLLLLFVIVPTSRQMQDYSVQYVAQIEVGNVRGENEIASQLSDAVMMMQKNDWDNATAIIDEVLEHTSNSQEEQVRDMHDNALWLKALCLMHDGKVLKAKRILRKIANSENHYSEQAAELLESF